MQTLPDSRIAIIGSAFRFPGEAGSHAAYWALLQAGRTALRDTPAERFDIEPYFDADPGASGTTYARRAGYVDGVFEFDPAFFGISRAEALAMDPQQRWMLELSWHALEHAGIVPSTVRGRNLGVFAGSGEVDYGRRSVWSGDPHRITTYARLGTNKAVLAGRIAYCLGVHGPAVFVDTACSSSLAAVHLAAQSLASGDCDIALAGGINLILGPEETIAMARLQAMSRSEACRPFDAAADGYMRGEGGGMIVMKRLADALRERDRIDAVLAGSAINSDGASNGLTAPNGAAQERVIRRALERAGVGAEAVAYVEAHGTGTPLGDPIELGALRNVYTHQVPRAKPLLVGSVKAQLGHLESAAGIAGLIKALLVLRHGEVPAQANFAEPNPRFRWDGSRLEVPRERVALAADAHVGVSSFGISGTNVHLVLARAPRVEAPPLPARERVLPLSARSRDGCRRLALALREQLANPGTALRDACYTASVRREHWATRVALVGTTRRDFVQALDDFIADDPSGRWHAGEAEAGPGQRGKLVFLFPGQGAWKPGVGGGLYRDNPFFHRHVDRALALLDPALAREVLGALHGERPAAVRHRVGQLAHFVFLHSLAQAWIELGCTPDVVIGHSLGEHVAAVIAGVMSVQDGLKAVEARGRLFDTETPRGAMLAVAASVDELHAWFEFGTVLFVAGINGPGQTVLSGTTEAIAAAQAVVAGKGRRVSALGTYDTPGHSPLLAPLREHFARALAPLRFAPPRIRLISTLTGRAAGAEIACVEHWLDLVEQPVRFAEALEQLAGEDCVHLEVGPGSALSNLARAATQRWDRSISSLADGPDGDEHTEPAGFAHACARLYCVGQLSSWAALYRQPPAPAELPGYPFERVHLELPRVTMRAAEAGNGHAPLAEPAGLATAARAAAGAAGHDGTNVAGALAVIRELAASVRTVPGSLDDITPLARGGFDSLALTELRTRLQQRFGRPVPVSLLARGASIASLAAFLGTAPRDGQVATAAPATRHARAGAPLVETLREGRGATLALVHPVGGDVLCYQALAAAWPGDPTIVGLRHPDLDAPPPFAARTLAGLAHDYRDALVTALGRLPDRLGGWSFGGLVAHEMAAQWEAQGHDAPPLLIIDSPFPRGAFVGRLHAIVTAAPSLEALRDDARLRELIERELGLAALRPRMTADAFARLLAVVTSNAAALGGHAPRVVDAPIVYALATRGANGRDGAQAIAHLHGMTRGAVSFGEFDEDHDSIVAEAAARAVTAFLGESHADRGEAVADA
ncbi:type I polyketide synthase [Burkholderia plantarii]|uniref:type I polyketide synthase n=1 Tax=Burkholderia plantarii TaxID=41899 RepID=UPI000870838F|nr:type I polyketide synthase [Burkholderia plantarii]